jgi:type I restriction enzyme S subunit
VGGTTRLKLTQADLLKLPVPIAPTEEQRRIVARTDELFAEIAEGEAALERARRDLDTWRRALLKAAVTGELTRTRHLEGATELGADLPAGWAAVPAQRLFQWSSGDFLPTKKMRNGNVPVFGGNGINGYHDVAMVGPGTIVVGRVGFYCGSVHLTSEPAWITDNAIFAAKMPDGSVPEYLKIALESCGLRQLAQGGAQPFINQKILNSVVLPIPPVSEQQQITRIMDTWGAAHQGLLDQIQRLEHDRVVLRQSILKAAFAGALAPQDARDEPASVLLERLTHTGRPPAIIARRGRPRSERARA